MHHAPSFSFFKRQGLCLCLYALAFTLSADLKAAAPNPAPAPVASLWAYEAAIDIAGRTGNHEQLGTAASLQAKRKAEFDTLLFYSAYDRQMSDGLRSADKFKIGADYQNNFSGRLSWYARDEAGFDRVKDIGRYNVAGAGIGYDWIKQPKHTLTTRVGLSFRYETYRTPPTPDVQELGLDVGLNHELEFGMSKLVNKVTWTPVLKDISNFRLTHESSLEMPITSSMWKLRVGIASDYNSEPAPGLEYLDVTYFTRLVLTWK